MLIAEYDYEMDIQTQREEAQEIGIEKGIKIGKEQGIEIGKEQTLISIISKQRSKGKSIHEIADGLDLTDDEVKEYIRSIEQMSGTCV